MCQVVTTREDDVATMTVEDDNEIASKQNNRHSLTQSLSLPDRDLKDVGRSNWFTLAAMVSSQVLFVVLGWNVNEHISSSLQCSFFWCAKQCVGAAGSFPKGPMWVSFFNQIQWFILFKHQLQKNVSHEK